MSSLLPGGEVAARKEPLWGTEKDETVAAAFKLDFVPRSGEKFRVGTDDQVSLQGEGQMAFDPGGLHWRTGAEGKEVVGNVIGRAVMLMEPATRVRIHAGAVPNQVAFDGPAGA